MEKKATLKDIARMADVSISTVSRIVNGNSGNAASKEIQDKIWDIVKKMNYIPNENAQRLTKRVEESEEINKSKQIACIYTRTLDYQSDPFFSDVTRSIEKTLNKLGYNLESILSASDVSNSMLDLILKDKNIDGLIILGRISENYIKTIKKHVKHIVYTGLNKLDNDTTISQVICDGYQASLLALNHLKKDFLPEEIYYLGETTNEVRYKAFTDFMENHGQLKTFRNRTISTKFTTLDGYKNMKKALESGLKPTAIFCGNDLTAVGALKALKEHNIQIPKNLSLVSIDNTDLAQFTSPMLSTVDVSRSKLGELASKLLIDKFTYDDNIPITILVPSTLILRESSYH